MVSRRTNSRQRRECGSLNSIGSAQSPILPSDVTSATKRSWHRADSLITPDTGVAVWGDKFGNGYDVAQATGSKQPTAGTLAGQATLVFASASAQLLLLTDAARVNALAGGTDAPYTAYIILSATSLPSTPIPFAVGSSASATTYSLTYIPATFIPHHERRDGVGADTDATLTGRTLSLGPAHLLRVRFTGTVADYILDGITLVPSVSNDVGSMSLDRFSIGAFVSIDPAGVAGTYWNGRISEIITYSGLLSADEESRLVATYFMPRYGVT